MNSRMIAIPRMYLNWVTGACKGGRRKVYGRGEAGSECSLFVTGGNVWLERYVEIISTGRQLCQDCQDSCDTILFFSVRQHGTEVLKEHKKKKE